MREEDQMAMELKDTDKQEQAQAEEEEVEQETTPSKKKEAPKSKQSNEEIAAEIASTVGNELNRSVGKQLTEARRAKGISPKEASEKLHIKYDIIKALEADDFESLPSGTAYTYGFLRTYANFLGLDPAPLVETLSEAMPREEPKHSLPDPIETSIMPSRNIFIGIGVLLVIIIVIWSVVTSREQIATAIDTSWSTQQQSPADSAPAALPATPESTQPLTPEETKTPEEIMESLESSVEDIPQPETE